MSHITYHRKTNGTFKKKNKGSILLALIIAIIAITITVITFNPYLIKWIEAKDTQVDTIIEVPTGIDSYQKLANYLAETARQVNDDELRVQKAIEVLEGANKILTNSIEEYNSAIDSWALYQGNAK